MAILHENPNVGIEYRALVNGEVVQSGSYFGKDAADFLNGINLAVGMGWLSPVTETNAGQFVGAASSGGQDVEKPALWPEGKPFRISLCLQWLLKNYFKGMGEFRGIDLNEVELYDGLPKDKATKRSEERRVGKECRSRWSP